MLLSQYIDLRRLTAQILNIEQAEVVARIKDACDRTRPFYQNLHKDMTAAPTTIKCRRAVRLGLVTLEFVEQHFGIKIDETV